MVATTAETQVTEGARIRPLSTFNLVSAVAMLLLLPPFVYYMWLCATQYHGALFVPSNMAELKDLLGRVAAPTPRAFAIFLGWYLFQGLLQQFAPGK